MSSPAEVIENDLTGKMKNPGSGMESVLLGLLHLQNSIKAILIMLYENPEIIEDSEYVQDIRNVILKGTALEIEYVKHKFGDEAVDQALQADADSCPTDPMLRKICPSCE